MSVISARNADAEGDAGRDGITLSDHVIAGATDQEVSISVDAGATIERVAARIYDGPQLDLELRPMIKTNDNQYRPLLEYGGKQYIDGDDDVYEWAVAQSIEAGEEIVVKATNQDGSNAYDYRMNFDLEYEGGVGRAISSILGGVL